MNACWQHKIVNLYLDQEGWPNQFQALQQSSPVETINYFSLQVAYSIHYEKWNFFSVWTIFWGVYSAVVYCWTAVSLSVWLILAFEVNWIGRNRSRLWCVRMAATLAVRPAAGENKNRRRRFSCVCCCFCWNCCCCCVSLPTQHIVRTVVL